MTDPPVHLSRGHLQHVHHVPSGAGRLEGVTDRPNIQEGKPGRPDQLVTFLLDEDGEQAVHWLSGIMTTSLDDQERSAQPLSERLSKL